jgi:hypothetical protein
MHFPKLAHNGQSPARREYDRGTTGPLPAPQNPQKPSSGKSIRPIINTVVGAKGGGVRGISIHASPALKHTFDVRFAPESDRLLRCRELTLWAIIDQSAAQQDRALFDHLVDSCE